MLMPAEDLREAALPLFEEGIVGALEWSLDVGWGPHGIPDWVEALLSAYDEAGRLYAHGVELSLLSARFEERQRRWLERFARDMASRRWVHVSEHYGFMTAGRFTNGTPLPHPRTDEAIAIGRDRIEMLRALTSAPVGLENLAFAFGPKDVEDQPAFLEALLAPSDGFLLLDVHNLYCQAVNYGFDPIALMERYPLERVRELHVAGGKLAHPASDPSGRAFRRDGHDDHVPDGAFELVAHALARCPRLEVIILEHTDHALDTDAALARYRADFRRLRALVEEAGRAELDDEPPSPPTATSAPGRVSPPREAPALAAFQGAFLEVLADARDPFAARDALRALPEASPYLAWIDSFEPRGLETGMELVRRWGARRWSAAPGMMRASVLEAAGAPYVERELPISTPGEGQALVRVHACGVCGTDVHIHEGRYPVPLPIVQGHEPVGVVEALGVGVRGLSVGDRIGVPWLQAGCGRCEACLRGRAKYCRRPRTWIGNGGGFAEHMIVEASGCVRLPDGLSDLDAAPLFCAGFTVMSGYRRARPRPGDRVAVLGFGGLGHLAVQIARAHGHEVIAVTRARTKTRDALALGAHHVLVVQEHAGRELMRMGGADIVLSTTSDVVEAGGAVRGLREEGRLVALGLGEGPMPIDMDVLLAKQATVTGAKQDELADLVDLLALAARGLVRPRAAAYPAGQLLRAVTRLAEGRVRYRAVMVGR